MTSPATVALKLNYKQVLDVVRQLPENEKVRLSRELEKEGIKSRLTAIRGSFPTAPLSDTAIINVVKETRKKQYTKRAPM